MVAASWGLSWFAWSVRANFGIYSDQVVVFGLVPSQTSKVQIVDIEAFMMYKHATAL